MQRMSPQAIGHDQANPNFEDPKASWTEDAIVALLSFTIRLWCLPFLLVLWVLTWTSIFVIRAMTALSHLGRARWGMQPIGAPGHLWK